MNELIVLTDNELDYVSGGQTFTHNLSVSFNAEGLEADKLALTLTDEISFED